MILENGKHTQILMTGRCTSLPANSSLGAGLTFLFSSSRPRGDDNRGNHAGKRRLLPRARPSGVRLPGPHRLRCRHYGHGRPGTTEDCGNMLEYYCSVRSSSSVRRLLWYQAPATFIARSLRRLPAVAKVLRCIYVTCAYGKGPLLRNHPIRKWPTIKETNEKTIRNHPIRNQ